MMLVAHAVLFNLQEHLKCLQLCLEVLKDTCAVLLITQICIYVLYNAQLDTLRCK